LLWSRFCRWRLTVHVQISLSALQIEVLLTLRVSNCMQVPPVGWRLERTACSISPPVTARTSAQLAAKVAGTVRVSRCPGLPRREGLVPSVRLSRRGRSVHRQGQFTPGRPATVPGRLICLYVSDAAARERNPVKMSKRTWHCIDQRRCRVARILTFWARRLTGDDETRPCRFL
jgi:hypothetical protein